MQDFSYTSVCVCVFWVGVMCVMHHIFAQEIFLYSHILLSKCHYWGYVPISRHNSIFHLVDGSTGKERKGNFEYTKYFLSKIFWLKSSFHPGPLTYFYNDVHRIRRGRGTTFKTCCFQRFMVRSRI